MKSSDGLGQHARATVKRCGQLCGVRAVGCTHLDIDVRARRPCAIDVDAAAIMPANSQGHLAGSAQRETMCSTRAAAMCYRGCVRSVRN